MKSRFLLGLVLVMAMVACQKNEPEVQKPEVQEPDYFPLTIGSYWVYNTYKIDSVGNETLKSENDTLEIIDSMVINDEVYKTFYGKKLGISNNKEEFYYRDSSGYIVNNEGNILFSEQDFTDTLYKHVVKIDSKDYMLWYRIMKKEVDEVDVPAGKYDSLLNSNFHVDFLMDSTGLASDNKYLYAPNVGKILKQFYYSGEYQKTKTYYEERLVEFHIAKEDEQ